MSIQIGRGLPHFQSAVAFQRGHGLGGVLGKFIRSVIPLFRKPIVKNTLKRIGKSALKSGLTAVRDSVSNKNSSFKENFSKQLRSNFIDALKRRQPTTTTATTAIKRRTTVKSRKGKKRGSRTPFGSSGVRRGGRRKLDVFDFQ